MKHYLHYVISLLTLLAAPAFGDSLIVGFNTATPAQIYSLGGSYQGDFGPNAASAGTVNNGLFYAAQPNTSGASLSTISALNEGQTVVSSFSVPDLIADLAPGTNNTLWLAGYTGEVYHVSTSGQVLSSFATGFSNIGIAVSGSTLYTTEGDASDGIDVRNTAGQISTTIRTGYTSLYGLGVDPANSSLYAGSFNYVYHFSNSGTLLNTLDLPGDFRTPNGAVHDGLEVADLSGLIPVTPVPEPATATLLWISLLTAALVTARKRFKTAGKVALAACLVTPLFAQVSVTLTPSANSVAVGHSVSFVAHASDPSNSSASFTYQFSVSPGGTGVFAMVQDFYDANSFTWTPSEHEGSYDVQVVARSSSGTSGSSIQTVAVSPLATSAPAVNSTDNPLVALYSAPPCSAPAQVRVRFQTAGDAAWQITPLKACTGTSLNFYIAGMRPNTQYSMQQDTYNGPFNAPGPAVTFTTGSLPANSGIPAHSTITPQQAPSDISYPFVWRTALTPVPYAVDGQQNVAWYFDGRSKNVDLAVRPIPGGSFTAVGSDPSLTCPQTGDRCAAQNFFDEFDLAGNLVHQTNATVVNQQVNALAAAQGARPVNLKYFNHEGYRLPNGYTATLIENEQVVDQGSGNQDVFGDVVLVLDQNFQVVWYWNSFDHLDITRKALLNDVCSVGQQGCPIIQNKQPNGDYYTQANDWTHCNAISDVAADGNLIVSVRHQDWVIKLNYANGAGDGSILWRLGEGGSFRLADGAPGNAWFSYQHDPDFQANGTLTLFDNGNVRHSQSGGNSRGQAWQLDETNLIATPVLNVDLGAYSSALGSAQYLSNGNYSFGAGFINFNTDQTSEFTSSGSLVSRSQNDSASYRDFRLHDLYATPLQ